MKESTVSDSAFFVTLTYNTDTVPITPNGFKSLDETRYYPATRIKTRKLYMAQHSSHIQLFIKRLRKRHKGKPIKYYICGEYGEKSWRPHYHIIIFNASILDIEAAWTYGTIHSGEVSEASVGYTLKYMSKHKKIPQHKRDDRVKEYSNMSKGLGANYLTPAMNTWHKKDLLNRMYIPLNDGKKIAMPRYYKQKIYTDHQRKRISNHIQLNQDLENNAKTQAELATEHAIKVHKTEKLKKDSRLNTKL